VKERPRPRGRRPRLPLSLARDTLSRVALPPVLALPAEVTAEALPALGAAADRLLGADGARLVVDLAEVRFLGSGGLGELVKLGKRLRERGGGLVLARARPPIRKLVAMVGLDVVLPICETIDEARARLEASGP